jgi:hypothetical protein
LNYPYLIPGVQADPTSFVASALGQLGSYTKPLDARSLISVDYSQLIPAVTLLSYSFRVRPGGSPQLWIDSPAIDTTDTLLTFYVEGGIGGRAYEIIINTTLADTEIRTDVLTVNVLGEGECCMVLPSPWPLPGGGGATSGDGSITVNTAPRFFVSATPPVGANLLDRWYDTSTAVLWDFVSNGLTSFWSLSATGGGAGGSANILNITPILPDGVTTTFTISAVIGVPVTINGSNTLFVSVDGVWQDATTQYTAVDNKITFAQAPGADSMVFMLWFASPSASTMKE